MADSGILPRLPLSGGVVTSSGAEDAYKVPVLNSQGRLDNSFLETSLIYRVPDTEARLTYPNLVVGNFVLELDTDTLYILKALPSSESLNWKEVGHSSTFAVTTVAGKYGDVVLAITDIPGLESVLGGKQPIGDYTLSTDPRLADSRTPKSHASSHGSSGSDPITPAEIGAASSSHTHTKGEITDFPTLGTAASRDVPASGNANNTQVVLGNDTRLGANPFNQSLNTTNDATFKSLSVASGAAGFDASGNLRAANFVAGNGLSPFPATYNTALTYSDGKLTGVTYSQGGTAKGTATLGYNGSNLATIVYRNESNVILRTVTFSYSGTTLNGYTIT